MYMSPKNYFEAPAIWYSHFIWSCYHVCFWLNLRFYDSLFISKFLKKIGERGQIQEAMEDRVPDFITVKKD